jgi:hypothetical protein
MIPLPKFEEVEAPGYAPILASTLATWMDDQTLCPRAVSARATPFSEVVPAVCVSAVVGASSIARASARAWWTFNAASLRMEVVEMNVNDYARNYHHSDERSDGDPRPILVYYIASKKPDARPHSRPATRRPDQGMRGRAIQSLQTTAAPVGVAIWRLLSASAALCRHRGSCREDRAHIFGAHRRCGMVGIGEVRVAEHHTTRPGCRQAGASAFGYHAAPLLRQVSKRNGWDWTIIPIPTAELEAAQMQSCAAPALALQSLSPGMPIFFGIMFVLGISYPAVQQALSKKG